MEKNTYSAEDLRILGINTKVNDLKKQILLTAASGFEEFRFILTNFNFEIIDELKKIFPDSKIYNDKIDNYIISWKSKKQEISMDEILKRIEQVNYII
jgi:hypothetical protein